MSNQIPAFIRPTLNALASLSTSNARTLNCPTFPNKEFLSVGEDTLHRFSHAVPLFEEKLPQLLSTLSSVFPENKARVMTLKKLLNLDCGITFQKDDDEEEGVTFLHSENSDTTPSPMLDQPEGKEWPLSMKGSEYFFSPSGPDQGTSEHLSWREHIGAAYYLTLMASALSILQPVVEEEGSDETVKALTDFFIERFRNQFCWSMLSIPLFSEDPEAAFSTLTSPSHPLWALPAWGKLASLAATVPAFSALNENWADGFSVRDQPVH